MEISKAIKRKGFTIQQVADAIGIQRVTLAKTIGSNGNPTISTLRKIADVIGCDITDLFLDEVTHGTAEASSHVCPHCGKPIDVHLTTSEV